jgi:TusA-related sulfurtransferase
MTAGMGIAFQKVNKYSIGTQAMTANTKRNTPLDQDIPHHGTFDLTDVAEGNALTAVAQALNTLRYGQVLLVLGNAPGLESDLFSWADHTNNQILAVNRTLPAGLGFYLLKGDPWPVDVTLDTRSAPCPTPVVLGSRRLASMHSGQHLRLATACHAAVGEVDAWLRHTRHRLLGITEDARGVYRFYIRKT